GGVQAHGTRGMRHGVECAALGGFDHRREHVLAEAAALEKAAGAVVGKQGGGDGLGAHHTAAGEVSARAPLEVHHALAGERAQARRLAVQGVTDDLHGMGLLCQRSGSWETETSASRSASGSWSAVSFSRKDAGTRTARPLSLMNAPVIWAVATRRRVV